MRIKRVINVIHVKNLLKEMMSWRNLQCKRQESSHLPSVYLPDKHQFTASKDTQREKIIPTCNTCQKTFTRSDGLTKHVRTHAYFVKKYECVSCEKKFSRKDNYNVHMKQQFLFAIKVEK